MRLQGAKKVHYDSGPNMTPLVDVVMVILIFLMLAGSFGANEHYLTSNLPISQGGVGGEPDPGVVPDERFSIQIMSDKSGSFRVMADNVNLTNLSIDPESGSRERLIEAFTKQKGLMISKGGTSVNQIQVILAPSASTLYEHIALVYEAALKAEFKKVAFQSA